MDGISILDIFSVFFLNTYERDFMARAISKLCCSKESREHKLVDKL
jgi:hypothetical protein